MSAKDFTFISSVERTGFNTIIWYFEKISFLILNVWHKCVMNIKIKKNKQLQYQLADRMRLNCFCNSCAVQIFRLLDNILCTSCTTNLCSWSCGNSVCFFHDKNSDTMSFSPKEISIKKRLKDENNTHIYL